MKNFKDKVKALDCNFNLIEILTIKTKINENALLKARIIYKDRKDIFYFQWA